MSARDDGGPAFPAANPAYDDNWDKRQTVGGMSLRDYFAAKAMQGAITGMASRCETFDYPDCAELAYDMADAMLEARKA